jgi:hypothetical protein
MKTHYGGLVNALQSTRADSGEKATLKEISKRICQKLFLIRASVHY